MEQVVTVIIKGMVCCRCVLTLKQALETNGIKLKTIELGKIKVVNNSPEFNFTTLFNIVTQLGFEVLQDRQAKMVGDVKELAEWYITSSENRFRFSELLKQKLYMNYDQISSIFSARENMTIEQYIIMQRVNKVKQLLSTTKLTVTDISYQTNYNSVHHLSRQFKELVGLNPSEYREMVHQKKI